MELTNTGKEEPFLSFRNPQSKSFVSGVKDPDLYEWPKLFEESREMMETAILMYTFADLRALAKKGILGEEDGKKVLSLPISPSAVMGLVQSNTDKLREHIDDVDFYLSALESIHESVRNQEIDPETGEAVFHSTQVLCFDDDNADRELVYGIGVNSARKRITVAFRGSVTVQDFTTDANAIITEVPNPVVSGGAGLKQSALIGVHHGFRDYLYGSRRIGMGWSSKRSKVGGADCKCQKIMQEVQALFDQYPDYKLYVTGHSLGGALATLFGFEAAADSKFPKPITCINVASPKVGNMAFRRAFQALERQGQIRCLRVANYKDIVTLLPDRGSLSCMYIMCCQSNVYRHVGMELKLYKPGKYAISRPDDAEGYFHTFLRDWKKQVINSFYMILTLPLLCCAKDNDFLNNHGCKEYMERLMGNETGLKDMSLNGLYRDNSRTAISD